MNHKTLKKHISCECKYKNDGRKCYSNQKWSNDKCRSECKNSRKHVCKKDYIWNPITSTCEIGKYLQSIIPDSVSTCDKNLEVTISARTKVFRRNYSNKNYSSKNFSNKNYLNKNYSNKNCSNKFLKKGNL